MLDEFKKPCGHTRKDGKCWVNSIWERVTVLCPGTVLDEAAVQARLDELEDENAILRERLLERNNVHLRLVKMRAALERIAQSTYGAHEYVAIAREVLEEDRGPLTREEYIKEMEG